MRTGKKITGAEANAMMGSTVFTTTGQCISLERLIQNGFTVNNFSNYEPGEMVDIEDVINNEPIYSKYMLSFITEQFGIELTEGVFRQRLLMNIIKEALEKRGVFVVRNGDDLIIDGKKLSVSIATKSITSILIHTGLNILSEGAPVSVAGLKSELGIEDTKSFAIEVMNNYAEEIEDIKLAATKVRGVIE